jgi:SAM-dependent methyltransferase
MSAAGRAATRAAGRARVPRRRDRPDPRELGPDVEFRLGVAEALPLDDNSVDLVWCRDVLVHATDLDAAYREFARVLRSGGRALVYQMFAGDRLEPREAEWLFPTMAVVPETTDPARTDAAISASGLRLDERIVLGTEWGEWRQEQDASRGGACSTRRACCATPSGTPRSSASGPRSSCSGTASGTSTR